MQVCGALLAGGAARRFGRDKAIEPVAGKTMIDHVYSALAPHCAVMVVCGRPWGGLTMLDDIPEAGLGPLGGLNAALAHAKDSGCDGVLCAPIDILGLPDDLVQRLCGFGPAVFATQYLVGYWPVDYGPQLHQFLFNGGRVVKHWLEIANVCRVVEPDGLRNINRPGDLPIA